MLDIKFGKYRITSDELNYIVQKVSVSKTGKSKGEETYTNIGYYSNIKSLINGFEKRLILTQESNTCS